MQRKYKPNLPMLEKHILETTEEMKSKQGLERRALSKKRGRLMQILSEVRKKDWKLDLNAMRRYGTILSNHFPGDQKFTHAAGIANELARHYMTERISLSPNVRKLFLKTKPGNYPSERDYREAIREAGGKEQLKKEIADYTQFANQLTEKIKAITAQKVIRKATGRKKVADGAVGHFFGNNMTVYVSNPEFYSDDIENIVE